MKISFSSFSIYRVINAMLIFTCIVTAIIVPNDIYNIKKISLFILLLMNAILIIKEAPKNNIILMFGILFPVITTLISFILSDATVFEIVSKSYPAFYLLLALIIRHYRIHYKRIILFALKIISLIVVISTVLDLIGLISIYNNNILMFLKENKSAKVGKASAYIALGYMVFIQSSPLLLYLLGHSIKTKSFIWLVISLIAIFFSASRALWIVAAIEVFVVLQTDKDKKSRSYRYLLTTLIIIIILIALPNIIEVVQNSFVLKESGDIVRSGHLVSVKNEILESPISLIFGHGYADYFYSVGSRKIVNVVELSYWDLLRQIGLFGFIPFMIFVLYPIKKTFHNNTMICVVYIGYLIVAYTNPLLYTSTAFVMFILVYDAYYDISKDVDVGKEKLIE